MDRYEQQMVAERRLKQSVRAISVLAEQYKAGIAAPQGRDVARLIRDELFRLTTALLTIEEVEK